MPHWNSLVICRIFFISYDVLIASAALLTWGGEREIMIGLKFIEFERRNKKLWWIREGKRLRFGEREDWSNLKVLGRRLSQKQPNYSRN